jgi:hypothetical protein
MVYVVHTIVVEAFWRGDDVRRPSTVEICPDAYVCSFRADNIISDFV